MTGNGRNTANVNDSPQEVQPGQNCDGKLVCLEPDHRIVGPEQIAAIKRLKEITEYAQAVLYLSGPRRPASDEDRRLTALLDAETLPHDWERIAALLGDADALDGDK